MDVSGLGASAEELMEIEEDTHLQNTHSTGTLKQGTRHGKDKKHRSNHSNKKDCAEDGDQGPSMRELLMQDEISSDSDSDGAGSDINSDTDENSDIDSDTASGRITSSSAVAKKAAVGTADSKSVGAAVLTPEEALYVLDGDENHTKHSNTGTLCQLLLFALTSIFTVCETVVAKTAYENRCICSTLELFMTTILLPNILHTRQQPTIKHIDTLYRHHQQDQRAEQGAERQARAGHRRCCEGPAAERGAGCGPRLHQRRQPAGTERSVTGHWHYRYSSKHVSV